MIRLHVMDYQIIRRAVAHHFLQIVQPCLAKIRVYRIHNGSLLIKNYIRVIGNTIFDFVLTFKKIDLMIIHANIANVVRNTHRKTSFRYLS